MIFFKFLFKKIIGKLNYNNNIIKLGFDPTNYTLHIGHLLLLNFVFFLIKKHFKIIIIIGDFTTFLKKKIKKKEIIINSICLKSQIFNIVGEINIFFNSIWINKQKIFFFLKIFSLLKIKKYINNNLKNKFEKININNMIYPIYQAYDSLIINCCIEIGGTDQLLNIVCGRFIQKIFKKKKQNSILIFLLEKNKKKISKSNNIFLNFNYFNDYNMLKLIFYNIKNYSKKKIFSKNHFIFFKNKKKNIYFKSKNFLSFFFKMIFIKNKYNFNNLIYNKKIFLNDKLIIKNIFLKKNFYNFNNIKIKFYD